MEIGAGVCNPTRLTTDLAAEYGALLSRYGRHGGQSKRLKQLAKNKK